ncbi:Histidine phosphatase superfamily, clade-2 [Artemisia annua]|uniref:Histidine phosphatase superfamily, clade-2 n=1 Tax=Artemisia annua TaxID=35608 RepID=A0A2U1PZG0_ARTAN|nr:Histidine phosphatase superfamily, clade-2 [Artemisia annua]
MVAVVGGITIRMAIPPVNTAATSARYSTVGARKKKVTVGPEIARRLLGKILIDLRNTREEAINVAELKSGQSQTSTTSITNVKEHIDHQPMSLIRNEESRRTSFTSEKSMDQDEDDDKEIKYRLDPK